jgi:hypothetical protein
LTSFLVSLVPTSIFNKFLGRPDEDSKDDYWIPLTPINPKNLPLVEIETLPDSLGWKLTKKFEGALENWKVIRNDKHFGLDEYRCTRVWLNKKDAMAGFSSNGRTCVYWGEVSLRQSRWTDEYSQITSSLFSPTDVANYIALDYHDCYSSKNVKLKNA